MVKITKISNTDDAKKEVMCSLYADTKEEVGVSDYEGLPEGYTIGAGSDIMTASLEVGIMKSDGNWQW